MGVAEGSEGEVLGGIIQWRGLAAPHKMDLKGRKAVKGSISCN